MFLVCADYKETGIGLIQWHIEVDLTRPGVNTTIEIDQSLYRLLLQKLNDILTANAMVADYDNLVRILQLRELMRDMPHRDINTAVDMTDLVFPGFPDVEQQWFLIFQLCGQLRNADAMHCRDN